MLYKAFISYSKVADNKLASEIQASLQKIAKPWYRRRSINVFRDETTLSAGASLRGSIEDALKESEYFLLLASPQAAQSPWVEHETTWWLENRSIEKMRILLTDGEIVWDNTMNDFNWQKTTALPVILRNQFKDEPLYVDFRWANKTKVKHTQFRSAVIKAAAPLYGKSLDELDGEDLRQLRKNKLWAWSAAIALLIATITAIYGAIVAVTQRNNAVSRQLAVQAELLEEQQANLLPLSVLLATEAMKKSETFAADQALYKGLSLLGPKPVEQRSYSGLLDLVLSPHGKYIVKIPYNGPAEIQETVSGKTIASLINLSPDNKPDFGVRQPSFSADEKRIATRSKLGLSTFVWELPSGKEVFRTPENQGAIITTVLSDDGNYLSTGDADGMVYLWNVSSGNEVLSFSHSDTPYIMKFSPDGRFLAVSSSQGIFFGPSSQFMVRLWDVEKNQEIAQLQHISAVTKCVFSPDGKYLATTSRVGQEKQEKARTGVVKVWETTTGQEVANMKHEEAVNTIAFTPSSKFLLTGSLDDYLRIWDIASGQEQLRIEHKSSLELVDFVDLEGLSPFFVTAGSDNTVRFWGAYSPAEEWLRLMESPNIVSIAHKTEGKYLVTISRDLKADASVSPKQSRRDVRVWTTASIKEKLRLKHEHVVGGAQFSSPDGRYLATFNFQLPTSEFIPKKEKTNAQFEYTDQGSGSVSVWDVKTRKRLTNLKHPGAVTAIDYDTSGKNLATACVDGIVRVFEIPGGKEAANLKHEGWVYQVKFTPDGQYVASSSGRPELLLLGNKDNALVTIWDWHTGKKMGHLQSDTLVPSLAFSPDGKLLAAGEYDGTVHFLHTTDAQEIKIFADDAAIFALAFSPDGSYLATASGGAISENSPLQKGATTLWKVADGNKKVLRKYQSWATTVAFSPDGKYLASMDKNGMVGIWTTVDGKEIASMENDDSEAQVKVNFSPDSKYLVTGIGTRAQIWEVSTGKEVARREHRFGYLWDVAFSPDGKYLATTSTDTTAGLWLWRPEDLINEACTRLQRNLTPAEWRQYVGENVPYHATCPNLAKPED